jgi:deoxyinosine 3'endonuclease (endonuclease V)
LAGRVVRTAALKPLETVAGIDVSICGQVGRAAVVVLNYPDLDIAGRSSSPSATASTFRPASK